MGMGQVQAAAGQAVVVKQGRLQMAAEVVHSLSHLRSQFQHLVWAAWGWSRQTKRIQSQFSSGLDAKVEHLQQERSYRTGFVVVAAAGTVVAVVVAAAAASVAAGIVVVAAASVAEILAVVAVPAALPVASVVVVLPT